MEEGKGLGGGDEVEEKNKIGLESTCLIRM